MQLIHRWQGRFGVCTCIGFSAAGSYTVGATDIRVGKIKLVFAGDGRLMAN